MKIKTILYGTLLAAGLFAASNSQAGAYMKLGDIKGEATAPGFEEWSDMLSVDWGIHRPVISGAGSTRQRSSATLSDVVCVKELDKASPKIMEAIATGVVFPTVSIHLTRNNAAGGTVTYVEYEMKNVMVTKWTTSGGASGDPRPTEQVSLNFEEIKMIYTEYAPDGTSKGKVEATWKVEEGTR